MLNRSRTVYAVRDFFMHKKGKDEEEKRTVLKKKRELFLGTLIENMKNGSVVGGLIGFQRQGCRALGDAAGVQEKF
jgi:hypothetical protein